MDKCDKYHLYDKWIITYNPVSGAPIRNIRPVGVCWGTKEHDECSCEGNRCNCDFYEDVRVQAKQLKREESLPTRIADLIIKINGLDLSGYEEEQNRRAEIINELLDIKSTIERRNT